jgi:TPR repeat protein
MYWLENVNNTIWWLVFIFILTGCAINPVSIMPIAIMETNKNAASHYEKAKKLEDEGFPEQAFTLYQRAANGRHALAAYVVGSYYAEGFIVPQNYTAARRYLDVAVYEQDIHEAYLYLADIDFNGKGNPQMRVQGYKWMLIATRDHSILRDEMRADMEPQMTAEQINLGYKHALAWLTARKRSIKGIENSN